MYNKMIQVEEKKKCCGCFACFNICPKQCINMKKDIEGFLYPEVNLLKCINCGLCSKVCPFIHESEEKKGTPLAAFAAKSLDEELRKNSSSGGIFSELASIVLNNDGVVYGCSMAENCKTAIHERITNIQYLSKLRGSKYFQSTIGNTYQMVKTDLEYGKIVLFSGVPCQINGLRLFLGRDYDKLLTIEVICHGVPSPKLWEKYVEYLESINNDLVEEINFRNKKRGWKTFGLSYLSNGKYHFNTLHNDPFLLMFLRNYCLRPSCYSCNVKKNKSMADITLADFWGVENCVKNFDDDLGCSLVLIHTKKAFSLFNSLNIEKNSVNYLDGIKYNSAYYESCHMPLQRNIFFNDLETLEFGDIIKKYGLKEKINLRRRIKKIIVAIIRKFQMAFKK